ncbi:MAG: substrate-binding periplasmic protein [Shewanella sp.]
MTRSVYLLILTVCVILLSPSTYSANEARPILLKFCVEDTEYPPFNYFTRLNGIKTSELGGYDIDLLERTFNPIGINYEVLALPWQRCLKNVLDGSIDAAMSASLNPQRAEDYIPSDAYYYLTPSYFYLTPNFGAQFHVDDINQLTKIGKVCGIKGFNYANFGWKKDVPIIEISSLKILPQMLIKQRCDFFLARKEIIAGTLALHQDVQTSHFLTSHPAPKSQQEPFYMLISKNSPHHAFIKSAFNNKVKQLRETQQLDEIYNLHLQKLASAN